jgi:hypothetical protein
MHFVVVCGARRHGKSTRIAQQVRDSARHSRVAVSARRLQRWTAPKLRRLLLDAPPDLELFIEGYFGADLGQYQYDFVRPVNRHVARLIRSNVKRIEWIDSGVDCPIRDSKVVVV